MNKKELQRLKRRHAERELKDRTNSEDRRERMSVLWRVLKQSRDGLKEVAQHEIGQTLLELVQLQRYEIEYLASFWHLARQLNERFPKQWQDLEYENALTEVNRIASAVLPSQAARSSKQKQEDTRRRQFPDDRVGPFWPVCSECWLYLN